MDIPWFGTLDIAHPYHPLLVVLGLALLFFRRGGYVRLVGAQDGIKKRVSTHMRYLLPIFAFVVAFLAIGIGLAEIYKGYAVEETYEPISRIIVAPDNSSSMTTTGGCQSQTPVSCVFARERDALKKFPPEMLSSPTPPLLTGDATKDIFFHTAWEHSRAQNSVQSCPRIMGGCAAFEALLDTIEAAAKREKDPVKHQVAVVRYSSSTRLQEPFTNDHEHLRGVLEDMDWGERGFSNSTNTHEAMSHMLNLVLKRNLEGDEGYTKIPPDVAREILVDAVRKTIVGSDGLPTNESEIDYLPKKYPALFAALRKELVDTSLVIITDSDEGKSAWNTEPSLGKLIRLSHHLGMPVYAISTEADDEHFKEVIETKIGNERVGEFHVLDKLNGYEDMGPIMQKIMDQALARKSVSQTLHRKTYGQFFAGIGLVALMFGFLLRETIGRTLTG